MPIGTRRGVKQLEKAKQVKHSASKLGLTISHFTKHHFTHFNSSRYQLKISQQDHFASLSVLH